MKNRSQPFHCAIAGKPVGISLRHGGGLQEPERVYVRCEERDCQYADQNVAPCPLRVEMFADGSDERVLGYLTHHAGTRICYACLTDELQITHDQVRRASWRLKEDAGFSIRPSRCGLCHHRRVTIGRSAGSVPQTEPAPASPHTIPPSAETVSSVVDLPELDPSVRAIVPFLEAHPEYSFCAHCLARELHGDPRVVREAMWVLDTDPRFRIRTAQCVSCLLTKRVVRFIEPNTETTAPRRVIEMLAQSADTAFCASCVAFSTDLALAEVRRVMSDLETVDEFMRREAACAACGRWQPVIGLRPASEASPARLEELGDLLDGSLRYRKLEIDLLSFRTANGWRPFALVKTPAGAIVPRAPAVLLAIVASKLDADELAAVHAREWIDKHLP